MLRCSMLTFAALLVASTACADSPITLKKGDRIVFLGDSITQLGDRPTGYVTLIKKKLAEKRPELGIEVINAGIGGNKVPDLQGRVERDVIARKPKVVFIYIGINDVWHGMKDPLRGTPPDKFKAGLKEVIRKIRKAKAQVVLCTPSVIGEKKDGANLGDAALDQYSEISRTLAAEMKLPLCDLRKAFVECLRANNPNNQEAGVLTDDSVHLNAAGNQLVADEMSKVIGL